MSLISIVIPVREGGNPEITLRSLAKQTFTDFEIIVVQDKDKNANVARNRGAKLAKGEYLLFSDDDLTWNTTALEVLLKALMDIPGASYSYGAYVMGNQLYCNRSFDKEAIRQYNFISTMSLIRRQAFIGFDETIKRLQDWALWLAMLNMGYVGTYCGDIVFSTEKKPGISFTPEISWEEARDIVTRKYAYANCSV